MRKRSFVLFHFVLFSLLPGRHSYFITSVDLIRFLNHCRTEEFSSKCEQPSLLMAINLTLQMLVLFLCSLRQNKGSIIKLEEYSGSLYAVLFHIFNQNTALLALCLYRFIPTVYCK